MKVSLIIPAAGTGSRMKTEKNKQYLELGDKPVLAHTIECFHGIPEIVEIIVVAALKEVEYCTNEVTKKYGFKKVKKVISGGSTRQESVYKGLQETSPEVDYVIIHDGARPFIKKELIRDFIQNLSNEAALVMGVPEKNTIKKIKDSFIINTIPREDVWEIQTPQGFRREIITQAFKEAEGKYHLFTDDSSMVEKINVPVKIFRGDYLNIKITAFEDYKLGEKILELIQEDVST